MKKTVSIIKDYFKGVATEFKKVTWPTKQDVFNHSLIVIVSVVIAIGVVTVIDFALSKAVEYIVSLR